jgi:hypothetical protein
MHGVHKKQRPNSEKDEFLEGPEKFIVHNLLLFPDEKHKALRKKGKMNCI